MILGPYYVAQVVGNSHSYTFPEEAISALIKNHSKHTDSYGCDGKGGVLVLDLVGNRDLLGVLGQRPHVMSLRRSDRVLVWQSL